MPAPHYLEAELEDLLRNDASIFAFIESACTDGLWYWDLEDIEHEWMSPAFWRTFGYEPSEKEHRSSAWKDMIHPDDLGVALANFERHLADPDHPYDQVVRYRHRDGSTVWVRCRGRAVRNADGTPIRMLGAHTDLTELKRRKDRMLRFERALPGVAFVLDADGVYVEVKATREQLDLKDPDALLGRRVGDILPAPSARAVMDTIATTLATDETQTLEYTVPLCGEVRWFEARCVPFEEDRWAPRRTVLWVAHDITARKGAEETLLRRNTELGDFAHVAAHDLRSPLRAIQQLAGWIGEDLEKGDTDAVHGHVDLIVRRSARMADLLDGLLQLAQTSAGAPLVETSVHDVVANALDLAGAGPDVHVEVPDDLPTIRTDAVLLQQALQNLIGNALKHHDRDDPRVEIAWAEIPGGIALEVRDDGPGIPASARERIFRIFETLRSRDEVEASGLGLSIVRKAVAELGGTVDVVPGEGRGATFRIELPARVGRPAVEV